MVAGTSGKEQRAADPVPVHDLRGPGLWRRSPVEREEALHLMPHPPAEVGTAGLIPGSITGAKLLEPFLQGSEVGKATLRLWRSWLHPVPALFYAADAGKPHLLDDWNDGHQGGQELVASCVWAQTLENNCHREQEASPALF